MTNRQLKAPAAFAIVVTFTSIVLVMSIFGPVRYQSGYEDGVAFERGRQFATARWDMAPGQIRIACDRHAKLIVVTTDYPSPGAFRKGCDDALRERHGQSQDK